MSLLRTSSVVLARVSKTSTFVMAARGYSDGPAGPGGPSEGSTARSPGWKKKQQAQENLYFQEAEKEKLKSLRESLEKQRFHLSEIDKHLAGLEQKKNTDELEKKSADELEKK